MNKLYGFLTDSPDSSEYYFRNTRQQFGKDSAVQALTPNSIEKAYIQFCADQLCRLCAEVLPDELRKLDPENSYAYPTAGVPANDTVAYGLPDGVTVTVFDKRLAYNFVNSSFGFTYDGVNTLTFGGKAYAWNDGTGTIQYQGFNITFKGTASGPFTGRLEFTRHPERALIDVAASIDDYAETEWDDTFEPYRDATLLTKRIAAFTLNAFKRETT